MKEALNDPYEQNLEKQAHEGLVAAVKGKGFILVADDQEHNMLVIKDQMSQLGLTDCCVLVYNGQDLVQ